MKKIRLVLEEILNVMWNVINILIDNIALFAIPMIIVVMYSIFKDPTAFNGSIDRAIRALNNLKIN